MMHKANFQPRILALLLILAASPLFAQDDGTTTISEEGMASWYGAEFHGRQTANGEVYDSSLLTAAHRTLPFGTIATVTDLDSGRSVQVRINDRGPFVAGRSIDLSKAAAEQLGLISNGVARVRIDAVLPKQGPETPVSLTSAPPAKADPGLRATLHTVQVASFANQSNAQKLVEMLRQRGMSPDLENLADSGNTRVVLRGVGEPALAATLAELRKLGFNSVIVRPQQ